MEWLEDNLAVVSGVMVPLLLGLVRPLVEREVWGHELRHIRRHAHLRSLLPNDSEAASKLDHLLASEVEIFATRIQRRIERKVDVNNLMAMIIISIFGGVMSFWLATWAQSVSGVWAWALWIIFAFWTLFMLLLVFVGGLPGLYKTEEKSS